MPTPRANASTSSGSAYSRSIRSRTRRSSARSRSCCCAAVRLGTGEIVPRRGGDHSPDNKPLVRRCRRFRGVERRSDRKSTRLNPSHANIPYAVFCLKKKNNITVSAILLYVWTASQISIFFFNDTATTEIYTLSLHDALPI